MKQKDGLSMVRSLHVGDRVWFEGRRRPFRVRAASSRFAVCTQPYNPMHTVNYCIVDLIDQVRGTENLVFGFGAESDAECQEMINRLVAGQSEVSHRNQVPLRIVRVERAIKMEARA